MNPLPLAYSEWQEIMRLPLVREAWGLMDIESPSKLASRVYGAKFNFHSGGPGYVDELYILQGDMLTSEGPMVLRRDRNGSLILS